MQFDLFRNAKATDAGAALNHASMASTVLEKIAASSVQRAAALPAVTRAEFDAAELERRQHFAAVGIDGNALAQRYGVFSAALRLPGRRVILEIKAASPSKGVMKTAIDLDDYAKVYGTYADALRLLGVKRAYVVHGSGLDEAAVHGTTEIAELKEDGTIERSTLTPADLGAKRLYSIEEIKGGAPADNALITEAILAGKGTEAQQAFVTANLALLLKIGGLAKSLPEAVELARRTMASGKGLEVLNAHRAYAASHTASSQKAA